MNSTLSIQNFQWFIIFEGEKNDYFFLKMTSYIVEYFILNLYKSFLSFQIEYKKMTEISEEIFWFWEMHLKCFLLR